MEQFKEGVGSEEIEIESVETLELFSCNRVRSKEHG